MKHCCNCNAEIDSHLELSRPVTDGVHYCWEFCSLPCIRAFIKDIPCEYIPAAMNSTYRCESCGRHLQAHPYAHESKGTEPQPFSVRIATFDFSKPAGSKISYRTFCSDSCVLRALS